MGTTIQGKFYTCMSKANVQSVDKNYNTDILSKKTTIRNTGFRIAIEVALKVITFMSMTNH